MIQGTKYNGFQLEIKCLISQNVKFIISRKDSNVNAVINTVFYSERARGFNKVCPPPLPPMNK